MMRSRWQALSGFFLAALIAGPVWGSIPPQPGTLNYIEGQASLNGQALAGQSVGSTTLTAGEALATQEGRAEILLTPGVFFRLDNHTSVRMINPGLADTVLNLESGRAIIEVAEIHPQNNIQVREGAANAQLLKPGLYEFDADHGQIRVFDGKASVSENDQHIELKGGRQLDLHSPGNWRAQKFDKNAAQDDFYRWASLRSSYLAEANVDAARRYAGGSTWAPSAWYGTGWYWDPWFSAYTFIPANGVFYNPFGWGFYSPFYVSRAPYFGFGYAHRFGPGYRPVYPLRSPGFVGRAPGFQGGAVGGFRGAPRFGGARGGGAFHGGGRR